MGGQPDLFQFVPPGSFDRVICLTNQLLSRHTPQKISGVFAMDSMTSDKARFLEKAKVVESGCHEWQSTLHRDGYGKFWFLGKQIQSHRVAYILFVGEIPKGKMVLHKCDNRKCVNIKHLYVGTAKQNVADKISRSKWYGRMKFSSQIIEQCKKLYLDGNTQQQIANLLGLHQTTVSRFVRNKHRPRL